MNIQKPSGEFRGENQALWFMDQQYQHHPGVRWSLVPRVMTQKQTQGTEVHSLTQTVYIDLIRAKCYRSMKQAPGFGPSRHHNNNPRGLGCYFKTPVVLPIGS